MAVEGFFFENGGAVVNAVDERRKHSSLLAWDLVASPGTGAGGVCRPLDLQVIEKPTPDMNVRIKAGGCFVDGSENSTQGSYFVYVDADTDVVVTAADPTNARKDIVGVQIRDSAYSTAFNDARLVVIAGTPAGSPAEPTLPANFLTLALIDIPANDTAIQNAQITDRRRRVAMLGGIIICTSSTRPAGPWEGMVIYETDTDITQVYNGTSWGNIAGATVSAFEAGDMKVSGRATPASGWLLCDGAAVSRTTYADLFTAISTLYGVGNGSTTFNVPDFRGRTIIGAGTGSGLTARTRGQTGGAETHQLTSGENGQHTHIQNSHTHSIHMDIVSYTGGVGGAADFGQTDPDGVSHPSTTGIVQATTATNQNSGSGSAHNNMQPWGCANVFIKT